LGWKKKGVKFGLKERGVKRLKLMGKIERLKNKFKEIKGETILRRPIKCQKNSF